MGNFNLILANIWLFGAVAFFSYVYLVLGDGSPGSPEQLDQSRTLRAELNSDDRRPGGLDLRGSLAADNEVPVVGVQRTNQAGIAMLKEREGLRLEAYYGPAGKLLIGYGHAKDVTPGMTISEVEAEDLLRDDLRMIEESINRMLAVEVSDNAFSAMVVLAYNIGTGAFAQSSVISSVNAGDQAAAADAFLLWNKVRQNGELVADLHLTESRKKERALFLS